MAVSAHGYQYDFFISFAKDGDGWARGELLPKLRRVGVSVLLEEDFDDGQPILQAREDAVKNSWRTLIVLTPGYFEDSGRGIIELLGFTRKLVSQDKEYPVVPIIFKEIDRGLLLNVVNAIDLTSSNDDARHREFSKLLKKQGIDYSVSKKKPESPYPGMSPFQSKNASVFFGRENDSIHYADYIKDNDLLVLTGVSGCGKSSLVFAGIIPQLIKNGNSERWNIKCIRPSMISDPHELSFYILFSDLAQEDKPLLFLDQFEEIFAPQSTGLTESSKAFLQALAVIAQKSKVIITVRDEFFPQLAWCQEWIDIDQHLKRICAMGRQHLTDAICKPASSKNVYLDYVLVERIVNDAGDDAGILPFIQETMRRLWDRMEERYIDIKDYEKLQGDGVSGLKYAIAMKANSVYKKLSLEQQHIARRIFIRLIQFGEGKPDTRRQLPVSKLISDEDDSVLFEKTLEYLASDDNRLLTLSGDKNKERRVDIVHESLITAWPQLQEWLKEFREHDKQRRILEFKVDEWIRLGEGESGLLDKGEVSEVRTLLDASNSSFLGI